MKLSFKDLPQQELIARLLILALFIYSCVILMLSSGTFDTGDGVAHYLISRYSWQHHHLFIDDWGKPFFTMVSSPFAQFGLKGITIFNILCGLTASYFSYKIADKLNIPFPYLAIIFTFSAPIYFSVVNSGLTEPMFSMLLILSIWLILNERYYLSAIVFSFLPYVRAEVIYVAPIFMFYYVLKRKFIANFLLPVGTIAISIIGFFYYKRVFWLITENPYTHANSLVYGNVRGDLFSYIGEYHNITGVALTGLIATGLLWFAGGAYFKKTGNPTVETNNFLEEVLLVFGCFINILVGHTVVWAMGIFPTLGLLRYMAPLIPLAAIIALRGLQLINLIPDLLKMPTIKIIVAGGFALAVLYSPYRLWYKVPFELGQEDVVIKKATDWLKQTPNANKKIYYLAPYVTICMDIDPYNVQRRGELWSMDRKRPDKDMEQGSIMVWDSHYGANEGGMKLDTLLKNPNLALLQRFDPVVPFPVLGGMNYGIWIFQKK